MRRRAAGHGAARRPGARVRHRRARRRAGRWPPRRRRGREPGRRRAATLARQPRRSPRQPAAPPRRARPPPRRRPGPPPPPQPASAPSEPAHRAAASAAPGRRAAPDAAGRQGRRRRRPRRRTATARRARDRAPALPRVGSQPSRSASVPERSTGGPMSLLVWAMMGIALWHFTVFVPDRFWGGIVGAFLASAIACGAVRLLRQRRHRAGQSDTDILQALDRGPRCADRARALVLVGRSVDRAARHRPRFHARRLALMPPGIVFTRLHSPMSEYRRQAHLEASLEVVWGLVGPPSRYPEWWPRVDRGARRAL